MITSLAFVCAAVLLCGCVSQPSSIPGSGTGALYMPMVDRGSVEPDALASDVLACRDTATSARVMPMKGESRIVDAVMLGVGIVVPFGLVGMALISAIVKGLGEEERPRPAAAPLQQKILMNCMARKGYRNLDPNVSVAYVSPFLAAPAVQVLRGGRDTYVAESFAKSNFCEGAPRAVLEDKGPGFERYAVVCENGQHIRLRCEFGNCSLATEAVASEE